MSAAPGRPQASSHRSSQSEGTPVSKNAAHLPSLRRELARSLTLISAVWLLAVFFTMAFGVRHEVDDLLDDGLQESAEVLYGPLVLHPPHLPSTTGASLPAPPHDERLVWQIVDQDQHVVLRSHKAPAMPLLADFKAGLSDSPGNWRVYAMRLPTAGQLLYVGQPAIERLEARYEVIVIVGASGVAVGLLCAVWLRRRVALALEPMKELSEQVMAYDPMRAQTELPSPSRQEFVEIRDAIVDLGRRLAARVENEQAFAAHAAHALRTPLAGMDIQLAMAIKEASGTTRPRLQRAREAVDRLKRVVTSLLALFRSNAALDLQEVDICALVSRLPIEALRVRASQESPLKADPDLLAAALLNLLDNAVRYGAKTCWLSCRSVGSSSWLNLRDDGPGLAPDRRATLQETLDRPTDEAFVGLGLKLAALVARAHHGKLVIEETAPDSPGFSVTMVLWLDEPPQ